MIVNTKTYEDIFHAIMNFFVHEDIEFIIKSNDVYLTEINKDIEVSFSLNENSYVPTLSIFILNKIKNESNFVNIDMIYESFSNIIEKIIQLVLTEIQSNSDYTISPDWNSFLKNQKVIMK
jgi:hypothetical protein